MAKKNIVDNDIWNLLISPFCAMNTEKQRNNVWVICDTNTHKYAHTKTKYYSHCINRFRQQLYRSYGDTPILSTKKKKENTGNHFQLI